MAEQSEGTLQGGTGVRTEDEKFCHDCGKKIKKSTAICPHCQVQQKGEVSKIALVLLALFLGGLGMHKFYVGKHWQGIFYILLCWTGIPQLIAFIEAIIYIFTSSEKLNEKYTATGSPMIIAIIAIIVGVGVIGILAAIAIPQYMIYKERAQQQSMGQGTGQILFVDSQKNVIRG